MNKTKKNYLMIALVAVALSPALSQAQELVVGVVEGHKIVSSTREADIDTLSATIISDLAKQNRRNKVCTFLI